MLNITDNYPMKNVTTLQIGGPAKKFVSVSSEEELIEAIQNAKQNNLDYLIIGGGSNLLVNDNGIDSLVIKNEIGGITTSKVGFLVPSEGKSDFPEVEGDSFEVRVKSGTILQNLVDYTIQHGLSGLQKLTGIPGTVGGAVYGNAGAYGQTISDNILSVVVLSERSESKDLSRMRVTLSKNDCNFNYRDSGFKRNHFIILEVTFQLEIVDPEILAKEAEDVLSKRLVKYPKGIKCPGSFFKNIIADTLPKEILQKIPKDKITYGKISAGYLLETVGAQGQILDGIEIAPYHANLFINNGGGTAKAFYDLAQKYAQKVKEKFGITLEPEVQLINLPPIT
ncbi:UDP-N-acetylmuramate dehydrogenase [Candidatus Microgenomates bacterium]|nr:UDP-N-acetylmuramate dehydrogenase [Candidatus Microgenomates bacterium]